MKTNKENIVLKAKNLAIGYKTRKSEFRIGETINFELSRGELVGLVGANGIGKSTLIRTLTKVQPELDGLIEINNRSLKTFKPAELARALSVVLTESIASKNLTAYEIVALGRQPYTNWIGSLNREDNSAIEHAVERSNISDYKDKKGYELSDGQLQKVMIARALAQDTDLIILDEPTTHLDMYHKAYILTLLNSLAKETNKTILFSSHEIDLAIQLCDKIIIMNENEVLIDTPGNHIRDGNFSTLFSEDLIIFDATTGSFKVNK